MSDTDTPIPGNENVIREQIRAADGTMGEMLLASPMMRARVAAELGVDAERAIYERARAMMPRDSKWRCLGDYDCQLISGVKFYTSTIVDMDDTPVAIVYGSTRDECRERAESI